MQSVAPVPADSIGLTSSRGVMTHVETEEGMAYLSIEESTRHLLDMAKFYHIRLENIKLE